MDRNPAPGICAYRGYREHSNLCALLLVHEMWQASGVLPLPHAVSLEAKGGQTFGSPDMGEFLASDKMYDECSVF
jgi:hypothetical protein